MGESTMEELGLKCGIEIHQQAGRPGDTKLFCNCPAEIVERDPDIIVKRYLRAAAGETGTVDVAAAAAQMQQKEFVYNAYDDTTCLVELDEEPPHPVNDEVITTGIMVAKLLQSTILPNVQFMRKTIIDGSNVSGFQRTGLFALGGTIPGLTPPVRIQSICIEEEAAKIVERTPGKDVYNLSRLGIPLLEIATAPDITTPVQAKNVAAQLGMVLRSTKRVKRGLGTIRQDLNVSITGGNRCEIKGAQDLRMIPTIITNEARRQEGLLELKKELAGKDIRFSDIIDVTREFKKSDKGFVQKALGHALGFSITGFKGILGKELCQGYRVGTELADLAKTRGLGGIIHSDENMKSYGVSTAELVDVFGLEKDEAFIVILGDQPLITRLIEQQIVPRMKAFSEGVPQEVRKANPDGTSSYLRPVPGAARMYPETDIPLVTVDPTGVSAPKLLTEQAVSLAKATGLSKEIVAHLMADDIPIATYKERYPNLSYEILSNIIVAWPRDVATRVKPIQDVHAYLDPLLDAVDKGTVAPNSVKAVYERIAKESIAPKDLADLLSEYAQLPEQELVAIVEKLVTENPDLDVKPLMGLVMAQTKGRADGKRVMQLVTEQVGK